MPKPTFCVFIAEPFSYNVGSRRVLEIAGFQFEGILRCNAVKNGRTEDMALYALTRSTAQCTVKRLAPAELPEVLSLIWEVFSQFKAPEYSEQGVQEFRASLDDDTRNRAMFFYGAYVEKEMVGVLATRKPQHIGYFFVKAAYHRRGIGKTLFEVMRQDYANQMFTVNSSPYAVKIYQHLGFSKADTEQTVKCLRFILMKLEERT